MEVRRELSWPAPAKLNLFLHITGRRADGYHLLQTVFQLLDAGDELRFRVTDDGVISRAYDLPGVSEEADLVLRAARALQAHSHTRLGAAIHLSKRLPQGGGLGGGSSDAATTLVALNHLWQCGLSPAALAELGVRLGADIPVFVHGHSAWAEGVGEVLAPVELPGRWFVVLAPQVNVSTPKVFSDPQLIRDCPPITIRDFLAGRGQNVCEPVVRTRYPEVAAALEALSRFRPARLTGTGACVFAAFATEQDARSAWAELAGQWQGFVAKGVNTSPLLTTLQQAMTC
ncbi:MAG: 4-(cytidine 5'-diphospho)-2-C-methyl-D-erythritol kinase [Gammaproteobacteria bacterium]|nr:4-(cytidine 5'-diphospho)-2-C-methyl-D-erythritol kinase [Gammaproteobacteria bacterium]